MSTCGLLRIAKLNCIRTLVFINGFQLLTYFHRHCTTPVKSSSKIKLPFSKNVLHLLYYTVSATLIYSVYCCSIEVFSIIIRNLALKKKNTKAFTSHFHKNKTQKIKIFSTWKLDKLFSIQMVWKTKCLTPNKKIKILATGKSFCFKNSSFPLASVAPLFEHCPELQKVTSLISCSGCEWDPQ